MREVSRRHVQLAAGIAASERSSCRGRSVRHALDREAVSGGHGRCERKTALAFVLSWLNGGSLDVAD